jgi:hypothetical protein
MTIDDLRALRDAMREVGQPVTQWFMNERAASLLRACYRAGLNKRNQRHMDNKDRVERAYQRQGAAIAAKKSAPKPTPRATPIRLGEHVKLQPRVIAGPQTFTEQLRARTKRVQKGQTKR